MEEIAEQRDHMEKLIATLQKDTSDLQDTLDARVKELALQQKLNAELRARLNALEGGDGDSVPAVDSSGEVSAILAAVNALHLLI